MGWSVASLSHSPPSSDVLFINLTVWSKVGHLFASFVFICLEYVVRKAYLPQIQLHLPQMFYVLAMFQQVLAYLVWFLSFTLYLQDGQVYYYFHEHLMWRKCWRIWFGSRWLKVRFLSFTLDSYVFMCFNTLHLAQNMLYVRYSFCWNEADISIIQLCFSGTDDDIMDVLDVLDVYLSYLILMCPNCFGLASLVASDQLHLPSFHLHLA